MEIVCISLLLPSLMSCAYCLFKEKVIRCRIGDELHFRVMHATICKHVNCKNRLHVEPHHWYTTIHSK